MVVEPELPVGFSFSRPSSSDASSVAALVGAVEMEVIGEIEISVADILADWERPGFDREVHALLVWDQDVLVAEAEVWTFRAEVIVHPSYQSRGLGSALCEWTERMALSDNSRRVGQTIADSHTVAVGLLRDRGYEQLYTSWALRFAAETPLEHGAPPPGITIRPYQPHEEEDAYEVIEMAFRDWPNRPAQPVETWRSFIADRPDFDPSLLIVAADGPEIVGAAFCIPYPDEGWIQQLAVQRSHRGRGIAKALLAYAHRVLAERGYPNVGLSTDSRTGALDLYLGVGMYVRRSYTHYSKALQPLAT